MNIGSDVSKTFLKWSEVVFHLILGAVGIVSFIYDSVLIGIEEIIGSVMIISSTVNIIFLFKPISKSAYEKVVVLTSVAILFRPLNAFITQIINNEVSLWAVFNYSAVWISLWILYMVKVIFISIPYLTKKYMPFMPENALERQSIYSSDR